MEGDFVTKQARFAFKNGSISFPRHAALCLDLFQYIDVSSQKGKDLKHLNTDVVKIKKDQKEENEEEMTQWQTGNAVKVKETEKFDDV